MTFIETKQGHFVNVDHVAEMVKGEDDHTVTLLASDRRKLGTCWPTDALRSRLQIVPAAPGHSLLLVVFDDDGNGYLSEQPIIAFGFSEETFPVPITVEGIWLYGYSGTAANLFAVKMPDGRVYEQAEGGGYENAGAFLAYEIEQHREREAERKAKADAKATVAE